MIDYTQAAGTDHVSDLSRIASRTHNHLHRDLKRRLAKRSMWPKLYNVPVRCWSNRLQAEHIVDIPVALPHEMLDRISQYSDNGTFASTTRLTSQAREHFNKAVREMSEGTPVVPLGLWLDGTPCNWDRTQSVETMAMSFPGHTEANLRVPFTAVMKRHVVSPRTFDDLLTVFAWSLKWLALGYFPPCRHEGEPFRADEQYRAKTAGGPLRVKGVLVELRGDWACMKEVFRLPGWHGAAGAACCFRCTATLQTMKIVGLDAPWRAERRSHWQLLDMWRQQGIQPSPIIGAPWFSSAVFQLDWLHVMDIGVTLDFLANAFLVLLRRYPQPTLRERTQAMFRSIQEYYKREKIDSRLETLTPNMLQQKATQPPKLRARGAVARGLITYVQGETAAHCQDDVLEEATVKAAASHLFGMYANLSHDAFSHESLADHSRKFALLWRALEASTAEPFWRTKPKLHQMQELCEMLEHNPSLNWTYRDEDFGGFMAQLVRIRGGLATAKQVGDNALTKFFARHELPIL